MNYIKTHLDGKTLVYSRCSIHGRNEIPGCPYCALAETLVPESEDKKLTSEPIEESRILKYLHPCPFCNSCDQVKIASIGSYDRSMVVICTHCGANGPSFSYGYHCKQDIAEESAITAWNIRPREGK